MWRAHPLYRNYELSDDGQIQRGGKILSQRTNDRGYQRVNLSVNGRRIDGALIHVLVCEAYHGLKPSPELEVRHVNGDQQDNSSGNVRWGTKSENTLDQVLHGTHHCARRTECVNGHSLSGDNLYVDRIGKRHCRNCRSSQIREYKERKAA